MKCMIGVSRAACRGFRIMSRGITCAAACAVLLFALPAGVRADESSYALAGFGADERIPAAGSGSEASSGQGTASGTASGSDSAAPPPGTFISFGDRTEILPVKRASLSRRACSNMNFAIKTERRWMTSASLAC